MLYVFHDYPAVCAMVFIEEMGNLRYGKLIWLASRLARQMNGKAQKCRLFLLCVPTKCSCKNFSPLPFPYTSSNFSLPTWFDSYSSFCGNLCGCFAAREVYVLIIAYAELHKLVRQIIKYKTSIPKQGEISTVEITIVIKEEFCNYKNALTMNRKEMKILLVSLIPLHDETTTS